MASGAWLTRPAPISACCWGLSSSSGSGRGRGRWTPGSLGSDSTDRGRLAGPGVAGTLDFSLVGVLAALLNLLADAGVSVFVVSTFDADYLLFKEENLEASGPGLA